MQYLLKRYFKVLKWLYKKYTSKKYKGYAAETFIDYGKNAHLMSLPELWNFRRDFNLVDLITKNEITGI